MVKGAALIDVFLGNVNDEYTNLDLVNSWLGFGDAKVLFKFYYTKLVNHWTVTTEMLW